MAETEFGRAVIARLDELRLLATENRIDADLRTGVSAPLVAELEGLVIAHPMREPLAGLLMRALHASGRRGAALEVYEQTRKRLADQLGVDPSAELAALHLEILQDEPVPDHRTNLRAELTSFVGRDAELARVAARRLAEDQDNLHAAIRSAVAAWRCQDRRATAAALGWYWSLRSMKVEGAELIAERSASPAPPKR